MNKLDYSKIDNIKVDGIDYSDYPDFCDAYIASADYDGRAMTDEELDLLNEDYDFVYSALEAIGLWNEMFS
jgi:hypothetical protein